MKNIARKITLFLLSAIVMVTMLPLRVQAAEWYSVPDTFRGAWSQDDELYVYFTYGVASTTTPTESYYLKLTCDEDSSTNYYGTVDDPMGLVCYPIAGGPIVIMHDSDPANLAGVMRVAIFSSPIVETGKHYTVQLVKTSDGVNYTAIGAPSERIEVVSTPPVPPAPTTETPAVPEHPYWWPCYTEIKELGESNEPQTLVYEEGTALPIEIMQALQECPNVTLIFKCSYNDTDYEFTIPGDKAIVIEEIPWYGPLWLNQYYSKEATSTADEKHLVVAGDTLSKIAATHHTTVDALLSKNAFIRDKDKIYVGQMISY